MPTITLPAEQLREAVWGGDGEIKSIRQDPYDTSRWAIHYEWIFEYQGKLYRAYFSRGATEYQDQQPFENEDEVNCVEVQRALVPGFVEVPDPPQPIRRRI